MATRVEKQTIDGTDVVVGYGTVNIASYNAPVPPATTGTTTYTTQDAVVDVEIDYSTYYERLATALETIATNSSTMVQKITTIAEKQTSMETYQKKLKELGEGPGIHVVGPWEWVGLLSLYKLFIEEGKILEETNNVSAEKLAQALAKFNQYKDKVNSLPTVF